MRATLLAASVVGLCAIGTPRASVAQSFGGVVSTVSDAVPPAFEAKGDLSCTYGASDCNPCANDVKRQLENLGKSYRTAGRIRFDGYAHPTRGHLLNRIGGSVRDAYEHVQSIGRLAGVGNEEYMVFTHSTASGESNKEGAIAVVRMGAKQNTRGEAFGGMPHGDGRDQTTSNRTVAGTYSKNNHPGGLAVLGHYVYVAQWCQKLPWPWDEEPWCRAGAQSTHARCDENSPPHGWGFSVYDTSRAAHNEPVNRNPPIHRYYRRVNGEDWIGDKSTAGVAAVKLKSGKFLVGLSRSGGTEYGFYTSSDGPTGPFTFRNKSDVGRLGENANIVTECRTGDLYLLQLEASESSRDQLHLYKVTSAAGGRVGLHYERTWTFACRGDEVDGASDWCSFDAGSGVHVTRSGKLLVYATDFRQSTDGNIRVVEFQ